MSSNKITFTEGPANTTTTTITVSDDLYIDDNGEMWPKKEPPPCVKCGAATVWEQVFFALHPLKSYPTEKHPCPCCTKCGYWDCSEYVTEQKE